MRMCACNCGERVVGRDDRAIYASDACQAAAENRRRRVARLTLIESGAADLPAMKPTARRVLKALIAVGGQGATTRELCQPTVGGSRFGGRLFELREMGFQIDARKLADNTYRYTLRSTPGTDRMFDVTDRRAA